MARETSDTHHGSFCTASTTDGQTDTRAHVAPARAMTTNAYRTGLLRSTATIVAATPRFELPACSAVTAACSDRSFELLTGFVKTQSLHFLDVFGVRAQL